MVHLVVTKSMQKTVSTAGDDEDDNDEKNTMRTPIKDVEQRGAEETLPLLYCSAN